MIPYEFYKVIHLLGVLMIFLAYGGLIVRAVYAPTDSQIRRLGAITSGIGLVLVLVGGFGLQAKLHLGWPTWFILKLAIWVILGAMIVLINRKPELSQKLWWSTLVLGALATVLVVSKPF
jgi:hypothetical protein